MTSTMRALLLVCVIASIASAEPDVTGRSGQGGTAELVGVRAAWRTFAIEGAVLNMPGDYPGASSTVLPYLGVVLRP
jgi:hypothetical protein